MSINVELNKRLEELPSDYEQLAKLLLNELERQRRSMSQIEQLIKGQIREIVLEEME